MLNYWFRAVFLCTNIVPTLFTVFVLEIGVLHFGITVTGQIHSALAYWLGYWTDMGFPGSKPVVSYSFLIVPISLYYCL